MAYEMLQSARSECLHNVDSCARATAPARKVCHNDDLLPHERSLYDTHSNLDRWAATMTP